MSLLLPLSIDELSSSLIAATPGLVIASEDKTPWYRAWNRSRTQLKTSKCGGMAFCAYANGKMVFNETSLTTAEVYSTCASAPYNEKNPASSGSIHFVMGRWCWCFNQWHMQWSQGMNTVVRNFQELSYRWYSLLDQTSSEDEGKCPMSTRWTKYYSSRTTDLSIQPKGSIAIEGKHYGGRSMHLNGRINLFSSTMEAKLCF